MKACEMRETAVEYFNTFVAQISEEHRKTWDVSIKTAEGLRINDCTVMDIMKANITEVKDNRSLSDPATLSRAEHSVQSPEEQFISLGIEIEERQFLIPIDIDVPGHGPCCFDEHAADAEEDTDETDNHPTATFASRYPEDAILNLPSRAVNQKSTLQPIEVIFRTKQAHTLLQRTRDLICEKSFIYSHVVRNAPRKGVATRARAALAKLNSEIATVARTYIDLKASTAILDPNQPGSTTTSLSWIWCMNEIRSETEAARTEFNRVHYLRARARMNRWEEEYELLQHEMDWTSRFFKRQFSIWIQRAYQTPHLGARAHALRKASMWAEFKYQADSRFKDEFPPFIAP
ncbi:hypothetical protein H0H81_012645 [Sphagnurus paluster]|uniref:Uncharacterized protein n=1 Tax=Sphagnurus paluster TaxID=117069 RepID=A0A9P7FN55_9AGAR|nr:hypothetical protein H0H81_012645 [Sphagnurus paluster]